MTGFTLVDAAGGLPDLDLGALADGATVDLAATAGWASVRAELAARRPDVKGVALALRGPREADRTVRAEAPVSLFGAAGGDYVAAAFPDGAYTLTARPLAGSVERTYGFTGGAAGWTEYGGTWRAANGVYGAGGSGGESKAVLDGFEAADVLVEADVRLTSGSGNGGVIFRVSDPQLGRDAFHGYYAGAGSGSTVVLGRMDGGSWQELGSAALVYEEGRWYRLRVVAAGSAIGVHVDGALLVEVEDDTYASGSVGLRSSRAAAEWDNVTVVRQDGDPAAALPETTVAFTVTGGVPSAFTGFTLLDAADGASDADLGTLADGATLDLLSSTTGAVTVRADLAAGRTEIGSVLFELRGPRNFDRTVDAGTPWRLFGAGGNTLPNGSYTLTARAYAEAGGTGDALSVTTVTFTVTGSHAADAAAVTGFTLVDAAGGLPDPDLGALADGATVNLSATAGRASIRAELAARRPDVRSVVLALRGPREADRTVRAEEAPVSLFGAAGGDYVAAAFPDGAYTLTARPLAGSVERTYGFASGAAGWTEYGGTWRAADGVYGAGGSGGESKAVLDGFEAADVLVEADVRLTSGSGNVGMIFRVSDPQPGLNAFSGYYAGAGSNSRVVLGRMDDRGWQELGSAALVYEEGRWYRLRVVAAGSAIRVHVDGALLVEVEDDTYASGSVGLRSSRAGAEWDNVTVVRQDGDPAAALPETTVAFTVTGGVPSAFTGFTLLDAADGASDADLGALADGATLDLSSSTTGAVTVRANLAAGRVDIGSVLFELRGPRDFDRAVDAGTPWRLFGSGGGTLPNGSYTLTARAYAEAGGTGDALSVTTVTFTVTGSHAADAAAVTGVHAGRRGGRPAGSGSRRAGGRSHGGPFGHWGLGERARGAGGAAPGREGRRAGAARAAQGGPRGAGAGAGEPVRRRRRRLRRGGVPRRCVYADGASPGVERYALVRVCQRRGGVDGVRRRMERGERRLPGQRRRQKQGRARRLRGGGRAGRDGRPGDVWGRHCRGDLPGQRSAARAGRLARLLRGRGQ